jgi:hypothetical protein
MRSLAGCPIFLSGFATLPCLAIMLARDCIRPGEPVRLEPLYPPVEGLRRAVRELMEDFDARLLAIQVRDEALRQAQLAMKVKYTEPFYWGAFICQGDLSPLVTVESRNDRSAVSTG